MWCRVSYGRPRPIFDLSFDWFVFLLKGNDFQQKSLKYPMIIHKRQSSALSETIA